MSAVQYSEASPPLSHFPRRLVPEDSPVNHRSISQDRLSLLRAGQSLNHGAPHGQNLAALRSQHRQKRREQPGTRPRADDDTTEEESPSPSPAAQRLPAFSSSSEREELSPHSDFDEQSRREFVRKQQVRAKGGVDPYSQRDFQQQIAPLGPQPPNRALPNPVPVRARSDGTPPKAPSAFRPVAGSRPSSGELPDFLSDSEHNTSASLAMPLISPYHPPSRLVAASPMRYTSESDMENMPSFPPPPPPAQQPLKVSPAKTVVISAAPMQPAKPYDGSQPQVPLPSEPLSRSLAQPPPVPPRRLSSDFAKAANAPAPAPAPAAAPLSFQLSAPANPLSPSEPSSAPADPVLAPLAPHHPHDGLSASAAVRVAAPSYSSVVQNTQLLNQPPVASSAVPATSSQSRGRASAKEPPALKLTVPVAQLRAHSPASGSSGSSGSGARAPQSRTVSRSPMQAQTLPAAREAPAAMLSRGHSHGALLDGSHSPSAHGPAGFSELLSPGAVAPSGPSLRVVAPSPVARVIAVQPVPSERLGEMSPAARMLSPGASMMVVAPEPSAYIYQPPSQRFFSPSPASAAASLSRAHSAGVLSSRSIPAPLSAESLVRPVISASSSGSRGYEELDPASGSGASLLREYNPSRAAEDRLPANRLPSDRAARHERTHSLPPSQVVMASAEPAGPAPPPVRVDDVFEGLNPNMLSATERQQFLNFFLDRAACLDERIALLKQTIAVQSVQDRQVIPPDPQSNRRADPAPAAANRTLPLNRQPSPQPPRPAPRTPTLPRAELKEAPNAGASPSPAARSEKDVEFAVMYAYQLSLLKAMGFSDHDQCCAALITSHGDMQAAINILMDST